MRRLTWLLLGVVSLGAVAEASDRTTLAKRLRERQAIVPGESTKRDVDEVLGKPAFVLKSANGGGLKGIGVREYDRNGDQLVSIDFRRSKAALQKLAGLLHEPDERLAEAAASSLLYVARAGIDLGSAARALRKALAIERYPFRRRWASNALSSHRRNTGKERDLPAGCSHRRIWALDTQEVDRTESSHRCGACEGSSLRCVHYQCDESETEMGQDEINTRWEYLCTDCQVYTVVEKREFY